MRRTKKGFRQNKYSKASQKKKKFRRSAWSRKNHHYDTLNGLEQEVLAILYKEQKPQTKANIIGALSLTRSDNKMLSNILTDLCQRDIISCSKSKKSGRLYGLIKDASLVEGTVEDQSRSLEILRFLKTEG